MSGTHRDLLFRSISRCFASKNNTWGLEPMETSNSDARPAVLQAENHRWSLGPIETCYSGPEFSVCMQKPQVGSIHLQRLVILVLKALFCMHKTTGESWNPYSFLFLCKSRCFTYTKRQLRSGTHTDLYSRLKVAVLHAKTTDEGWDP